MMEITKIYGKLSTQFMGREIKYIMSAGSTNRIAADMAKSGAGEGLCVLAETQSAGRGRLGKSFYSPPETGIWLSVILAPPIAYYKLPPLTLVCGISAAKALRKVTGLDIRLKWPNDLMIKGRKAAGILAETVLMPGKAPALVMGVGINVNTKEFPKEIAGVATSLKIQAGAAFDREKLAAAFLNEFERDYRGFIKEQSFSGFLREYKNLCDTPGKQVTLSENRDISGIAQDIGPEGELIIKLADGSLYKASFGIIEIN